MQRHALADTKLMKTTALALFGSLIGLESIAAIPIRPHTRSSDAKSHHIQAHKESPPLQAQCDTMFNDPSSKFHLMWGAHDWKLNNLHSQDSMSCWSCPCRAGNCMCAANRTQAANDFFRDALAGSNCDINWFEGVEGDVGQPTYRPNFPNGKAPSLIGFDDTIWDYCTEGLDANVTGKWDEMDWNSQLAHRCIEANQNILRLLSPSRKWNMCQNVEWMSCAIQGKLPGQRGKEIYFATAPKDADWAWWDNPALNPKTWWKYPHKETFAVSDVFFVEFCMLTKLCRNAHEVFEVGRGEMFNCDFSNNGFSQLEFLLRS